MTMTKTERNELKGVVRQQFRVLRNEVKQRHAEVLADAEHQIAHRYADEDEAWANTTAEAHQLVLELNQRINDMYRALPGRMHEDDVYIGFRPPRRNQAKRTDLRYLAETEITAKVQAALLQLDRQEADLLRHLAVDALETEDAAKFLETIPTVGQLVPTARLAELEAQLGDLDDPTAPR